MKIDWPFAIQCANIFALFGTFIVLFFYTRATFRMARSSDRNLALTSKIAKREWRPELFIDIGKIEEPKVTVIGNNMNIEIPFNWSNSGGSPALQISTEHHLNRDESPYLEPHNISPQKGFTIWPGQKVPATLRTTTDDFKPSDAFYLHYAYWYLDREGQKYLQETVLGLIINQKKLSAMITYRNYEYDWSKGEWC